MIFSMIIIMLISVNMTVIMHRVKRKELTVEVGGEAFGLGCANIEAITLAQQVRDKYHDDKASVKIVWDIQQTIPPRSMNAS